ncbi:MAG: aminotransferase class I/II-fold pyridoxal phosphate-dependent enzyme [Calditrichaeota bacterium]|nr:MAG: aminotransferase class I/II-fold pyridoxal phosphate-dependent enzyme [Calditrichota bacterium]
MDVFDKCRDFKAAEDYKERGLYPYFFPIAENHGPHVIMDGREVIMIGSNNYLGLTKDPRVQEAAIKAIEKFGTSCSGSRFLNGTLELHEELEARLARFVKKEAALVFSTGYQTNLGAISTLMDKKTILITDKTNHASIFDGIFLGSGINMGAKIRRFKHNDMDDLENVLERTNPELPKMVITDGVFSMEGDIVHLPRMVEICKKYNARIYLDDAHGLGVIGATGRGTMEHYQLFDEVDLVMCTFSKSFASLGGFVAGTKEVINYIKHHSRPLIFSAAIPPANIAAVLKSLEIIEQEPEIVTHLQEIGAKMRREFKALGFDTGESETPIIPILVRNVEKTFFFWKALFDAGIYTNAVVSPAVPPDRSLLRTSFMATHSDDDLNIVLETFKKVGKQLGII